MRASIYFLASAYLFLSGVKAGVILPLTDNNDDADSQHADTSSISPNQQQPGEQQPDDSMWSAFPLNVQWEIMQRMPTDPTSRANYAHVSLGFATQAHEVGQGTIRKRLMTMDRMPKELKEKILSHSGYSEEIAREIGLGDMKKIRAKSRRPTFDELLSELKTSPHDITRLYLYRENFDNNNDKELWPFLQYANELSIRPKDVRRMAGTTESAATAGNDENDVAVDPEAVAADAATGVAEDSEPAAASADGD
jgi:hypothetical protein